MVAASIGSILDENGTTNHLRNAARSPGVLITKKRAVRIRQMLGISPQRWRAYVADWTDSYIAHRCSPGMVVLFTRPFLEECPACRKYTEGRERKPTIMAKPRGRPFQESAADASGETPQKQAPRAAEFVPETDPAVLWGDPGWTSQRPGSLDHRRRSRD